MEIIDHEYEDTFSNSLKKIERQLEDFETLEANDTVIQLATARLDICERLEAILTELGKIRNSGQ